MKKIFKTKKFEQYLRRFKDCTQLSIQILHGLYQVRGEMSDFNTMVYMAASRYLPETLQLGLINTIVSRLDADRQQMVFLMVASILKKQQCFEPKNLEKLLINGRIIRKLSN